MEEKKSSSALLSELGRQHRFLEVTDARSGSSSRVMILSLVLDGGGGGALYI